MYLFYKNKFIDYEYNVKDYRIFFDTPNKYINCRYKNLTKSGSDFVLKLHKDNNLLYVSIGPDKNKISLILNKFKKIVIRVYKNHQEYLNVL